MVMFEIVFYAYILMLIQSMIQQEENDEQTLSDKDIATVDRLYREPEPDQSKPSGDHPDLLDPSPRRA